MVWKKIHEAYANYIVQKGVRMKRTMLLIFFSMALMLLSSASGYASIPEPVPEPGTLMMLGAGLAGLIGTGLVLKRKK